MLDTAVVLTGLSCAGKTVGGEHLSNTLAAPHYEASSYMRRLWQESRRSRETREAFALRSLREDPMRVPRGIIDDWGLRGSRTAVISGFRSPKEVELVQQYCPRVILLVIEASFQIRLERSRLRQRPGSPETIAELQELDAAQFAMGMGEMWDCGDCVHLENEEMISTFFAKLSQTLEEELSLRV